MTPRSRVAACAAATLLCALAASAASGGAIESIYAPARLAERQQLYPRWVLGVFAEQIQPRLTPEERDKLAQVRFSFPQRIAGWEPFGFRSDGRSVELSIASLKLINDLMLAYAWLGRHGYNPSTVDDYMAMLANWRGRNAPPEPLTALGIPASARDDHATDRLATLFTRSAYLFTVLHELGHVLHGDRPGPSLAPQAAQAQEAAADAFALDLMSRLGVVPTGIAEFFAFSAAFMPNPAAYRDDAAYLAALRRETHPVTPERLAEVARGIDARAASFAIDQSPETLAQFRELSRLLRKAAAMMLDPDMRRLAAVRGAMLEPRDLAPRKPGALLGIPPGTRFGSGAFEGRLTGTLTVANVPFDAEMLLEAGAAGRVTGTYAVGPALGRLAGTVGGQTLAFAWRSADQHGRGVLHATANGYEGSAGYGYAVDGTTWTLRRAPAD